MNILDIIIFITVFIGFILGYKDGFIRKVIGLIGLSLAIYLAVNYSSTAGKMMEAIFGIESYLAQIIGGVVIFLTVIFIFSIIKRIIHPFDKVNNFINQLIGGAVGVLQVLFFLSALLFLLNIFSIPSKEKAENSLLYNRVYEILPYTINYIENYTPKTKRLIKDYINDKDSI